ncbi:MAG: hypothetical protein H6719_08230 [Sandaracinaceae bacterium]|nr:hypothetical protein [Sandaracinaceae bacterium]
MRPTLLASVLLLASACDGSPTLDGGATADAAGLDGATSLDGGVPRDGGGRDADVGDGGAGADGEHPLVYLNDDVTARLRARIDGPAGARFVEIADIEHDAPGTIYAFEPWYAALLGQLTGDAGRCADAIAWTDAFVADEEARIASGERPEVSGDSYLYVGPTIGSLALVYDWCFDDVTAEQRARWIAYANQAVHNVWNHETATWGGASMPWSGWSVDNPANNYFYSFLRATMLLGLATEGENDRADEWLRIFRDDKIAGQLVPTFERDLVGGGSREGTGYGTALRELFELYVLWQESTGERIADLTGHTRASLPHLLHAIVPGGSHLVPVGDHARESTAALFDYHRHYLLLLAELERDDPRLSGVAYGFLREGPLPRMEQPFMAVYDFLHDDPEVASRPLSELAAAYHGTGTGQFYLRSSWETDATLLHVVGGPLTESHAHEDQGSFLLWHEGWLAYDTNVESRSGIRQEPEMHDLVRLVRGGSTMAQRRERSPSAALAWRDAGPFAWVAVDAAPVYDDAAVRSLRRDVVFIRPGAVVVVDRIDVASEITPVWQLQVPTTPTVTDASVVAGGLRVQRIAPAASAIASRVVDWAATDAEMSGGYRVELEARAGGPTTYVHVLSVDGAVTAQSARGALGVDLTLADGRAVSVDLAAMEVTLDGSTTALVEGLDEVPLYAP